MDRNANEGDLVVIEAPIGSKTIVDLPDGTNVTLNANSKLKYSTSFNKENREVYLDGEGYFRVTKNNLSRFVVKTSDLDIKVFGTVFNVKSYSDEKTIETTLIEGSVAIHRSESTTNTEIVQLKPNQSAIFYRGSGVISLKNEISSKRAKRDEGDLMQQKARKQIENIVLNENIDTDFYTSWINNILIFNNERFETLAKRMERQYGAKISFTDESVKDYRFTGTFNEISIVQALNYLQFASFFNYKIVEENVFISK